MIMKIGGGFCLQIIHWDEILMKNGGPTGHKQTII